MNLEDAKEKKEKELASYEEYECKDYHLTALKKGDKLGVQTYYDGEMIYLMNYQLIDKLPKNEFIWASAAPVVIGGGADNYILQSPDNEVDVLEDWNIKKAEVCYWVQSENADSEITEDNEELVYYTLYESSDEEVITKLKSLVLESKKELEYSIPDNYRNMQRSIPEYSKLFLRFTFEETEGIAWDCDVNLYQSIDEPSEYSVTLGCGILHSLFYIEEYEVEVVGADQFCRELVEKFSEEFIN